VKRQRRPDAIAEVLRGRTGAPATFTELGRRWARDGQPLDVVIAWVRESVRLLPHRRRGGVDERACVVAAAVGWADGVLERQVTFGTDLDTARLSPVSELRLCLLDHYRRCELLGTDPSRAAALVALEARHEHPPIRAATVRELAAIAQRRVAGHGPVAVAPNGRVLVLAPCSSALAPAVRDTVAEAHARGATTGVVVRGWVEPLARSGEHLDAHLSELTS
jgi:hypothetical protein